MKRVIEVEHDDELYRVEMDLSGARFKVEVEDFPVWRAEEEPEPEPTAEGWLRFNFMGIGPLSLKAKLLEDRIYAGVELLLQKQLGSSMGKPALLRKLLTRLLSSEFINEKTKPDTATFIAGALGYSRGAPELPKMQERRLRLLLKEFEASQASSPMGFYTADPRLEIIFKQDRFLQTKMDRESAAKLARAVKQDEALERDLLALYEFVSGLTNPFSVKTILEALKLDANPDDEFAFFPASRSPEGELVKKLFGNKPVPEGYELIADVIERVKIGQLDLSPQNDSGWYERQLHGLEALLSPDKNREGERVEFGSAYREYLEEMFKSLLAMTRETHVKQLEVAMVGGSAMRPLEIRPEFSLEPLPEYYRRRLKATVCLRDLIQNFFERDLLLQQGPLVLTPGSTPMTLANALAELETLFRGAYHISCSEIGLKAEPDPAGEAESYRSMAHTAGWIKNAQNDPDLAGDIRNMVPIFFDMQRQKYRVLVTLGWNKKIVNIAFATPPELKVRNKNGDEISTDDYVLTSQGDLLPYPVTAEIYVDQLLNREEVRALCDKHKTSSAIIKALEGAGP